MKSSCRPESWIRIHSHESALNFDFSADSGSSVDVVFHPVHQCDVTKRKRDRWRQRRRQTIHEKGTHEKSSKTTHTRSSKSRWKITELYNGSMIVCVHFWGKFVAKWIKITVETHRTNSLFIRTVISAQMIRLSLSLCARLHNEAFANKAAENEHRV